MSKPSDGGLVSFRDSNNVSKVIDKEDVRLSRLVKPSPLQKRLEEQLHITRKANGANGTTIKKYSNGASSAKNGTLKHSDERPLFKADSDSSDEELNVTHFKKPQSASVSQNSKDLSDCTQQLLRDGYRLDEISDEEDLDLIPPRAVDDRCQCCGVVSLQHCVIS